MAPQAHHHRPTLKQSNKSFKSKHSSKGALKAAAKGKTASVKPESASRKAAAEAGSKQARLHQQAQRRDAKQRLHRDDAKFFSTSSGGGQVPRIVSIVPLLPSLSPERFVLDLLPSLGLSEEEISALSSELASRSSIVVTTSKFKTTLILNLLPPLQLYSALDAALVSDTVILLLSSVDEVQAEGETILRCLQGQVGDAHVLSCVQTPTAAPLTSASRSLVHKSLLSFSRYFFPSVSKIYSADTVTESLLLARAVCETSPGSIRHPEGRSWLVAEGGEAVRWEAIGDDHGAPDQLGNLRVMGTIRGGRMSANRLVHVPGHGDFQVAEIIAAPRRDTRGKSSTDIDIAVLSTPNDESDDLTSNNVPDLLLNEQTWPTEEDMMSAPASSAVEDDGAAKRVKRVPKGTSAYQAAWIFDDMEEEEADSTSEPDETVDDSKIGDDESDESEELEEIELDSRPQDHQDMAPEEEEREVRYETYLEERKRAQQEDAAFPDEIDTPRHVAARVRFQRYRGLRSFRTSPWDPYENLPLEYGEIFQFENFAATQKRVIREAMGEGVEVGTRVVITIRNVPRSVALQSLTSLLVVHGLLQHEHKQSVLHFVVQRNTEYTEPVRAKDSLILCVGPRRLCVRSLFSQHVRGGGKGVNNVHKSERYLRHGMATVMTTYGPVCFGKVPCLVLRESTNPGVPDLVATGSFMSSDPTRIIAKRIVLTGHPVKVHKKTATIRYMFFDRDDVDYFQTVELHTKYGRTGHVREALGTHGYFKAHFDGPIQQMDTICMSLYKRQFPKWSEEFRPPQVCAAKDSIMEVE